MRRCEHCPEPQAAPLREASGEADGNAAVGMAAGERRGVFRPVQLTSAVGAQSTPLRTR
jgi:hypothetical protein